LRMAIIWIVNGGKSNFHIRARSINQAVTTKYLWVRYIISVLEYLSSDQFIFELKHNKYKKWSDYYLSIHSSERYYLKIKQKSIHTTIHMVIDTT
jgi:hypothetical protein